MSKKLKPYNNFLQNEEFVRAVRYLMKISTQTLVSDAPSKTMLLNKFLQDIEFVAAVRHLMRENANCSTRTVPSGCNHLLSGVRPDNIYTPILTSVPTLTSPPLAVCTSPPPSVWSPGTDDPSLDLHLVLDDVYPPPTCDQPVQSTLLRLEDFLSQLSPDDELEPSYSRMFPNVPGAAYYVQQSHERSIELQKRLNHSD